MRLITKKHATKILALLLTASAISTTLVGCGAIPVTGQADASVSQMTADANDTPADSQYVPSTEISTEVPDECELTDDEMLKAIAAYGKAIKNSSNGFVISKNKDNSLDFKLASDDSAFAHFDSIRECFGYLYNRHQIDIFGNTTDFALGKETEDTHSLLNSSSIGAFTGTGTMQFDTASNLRATETNVTFTMKNVALSTSNTTKSITIQTNATIEQPDVSTTNWLTVSGGNGSPLVLTATEAHADTDWSAILSQLNFTVDTAVVQETTFKFTANDASGNAIATGSSSIKATDLTV